MALPNTRSLLDVPRSLIAMDMKLEKMLGDIESRLNNLKGRIGEFSSNRTKLKQELRNAPSDD